MVRSPAEPATVAPRVGRVAEIDLLRGLAALMVVAFHYTYRGHLRDSFSPIGFTEVDGVTRYGYLGVGLFFFISGFVILRSAIATDVRGFAISRVVRIYPAFWVACTATALAVGLTHMQRVTPGSYLVNMTMLQELFHVQPVAGVYWTLTIELRFYLLAALAIAAGVIGRARYVLPAWLILAFVAGAGAVPLGLQQFLVADWAPFFVAGACCHLLAQQRRDPVVLVTLALAAVLSCRLAAIQATQMSQHTPTPISPTVAVVFTLVALLVVLAVALGVTRSLARPWMVAVGALSYPLYLVHENLGYVAIRGLAPFANRFIVLVVVTAGALGLAWALHRWVEVPVAPRMQALLRRGTVNPAGRRDIGGSHGRFPSGGSRSGDGEQPGREPTVVPAPVRR